MMNHYMNKQELLDKAVHECRAERDKAMEAVKRKETVDAALQFFHETAEFNVSESFKKMYDAGYLRLPADKSS